MAEMRDRDYSEIQMLQELCGSARKLVGEYRLDECERMVCEAMMNCPHAAEPHNLMGIILEKKGYHVAAMKHFRAASALDPTYVPARENMERFGSFSTDKKLAFDESDCCLREKKSFVKVEFDGRGVGRVVRR